MKFKTFLCMMAAFCSVQLAHGVPLSRRVRQFPDLFAFLRPAGNTVASPQGGNTAGVPAPPSIFGLNIPSLGDLADKLHAGLNKVESDVGGVINSNLQGANDVVTTALAAGGKIANSGVKLAVDIPRFPLEFIKSN